MTTDPVPMSKDDITTVWKHFPGSPTQALLHNELVAHINKDRSDLEVCSAESLLSIQERVRARRGLLGFIHRNDKK